MTRKQYIELFAALKSVQSLIGSPTFSYAVAMNLHTLEKEIKALEAVYKGKVIHKEYDDAELAVIHSYCEKDEKGKPIQKNGTFKILEDEMKEFKHALDEVYVTFSEEKKEYDAFEEKARALLEEEITIELLTISKDDLPKEISPAHVSGLLPMIQK